MGIDHQTATNGIGWGWFGEQRLGRVTPTATIGLPTQEAKSRAANDEARLEASFLRDVQPLPPSAIIVAGELKVCASNVPLGSDTTVVNLVVVQA